MKDSMKVLLAILCIVIALGIYEHMEYDKSYALSYKRAQEHTNILLNKGTHKEVIIFSLYMLQERVINRPDALTAYERTIAAIEDREKRPAYQDSFCDVYYTLVQDDRDLNTLYPDDGIISILAIYDSVYITKPLENQCIK